AAPKAEDTTIQASKAEPSPRAAAAPADDVEVMVPDLGVDIAAVDEILVSVGDTVEKDQRIIVVESDKATVEVPSTNAGVIKAIHVEMGQNVSEGIALMTVQAEAQAEAAPVAAKAEAPKAAVAPVETTKAADRKSVV